MGNLLVLNIAENYEFEVPDSAWIRDFYGNEINFTTNEVVTSTKFKILGDADEIRAERAKKDNEAKEIVSNLKKKNADG